MRVLSVLIASFFAASSLSAQEARGSIIGKVTDPAGAVVVGATVTVTSESMGTKQTLATNETGAYQVSFLIPGL